MWRCGPQLVEPTRLAWCGCGHMQPWLQEHGVRAWGRVPEERTHAWDRYGT